MRVLWLPAVLRAAGLTVHEVSGWKSRGADSFGPVRGITCHHTAGARNSSDAGEINVLVNGRVGLEGPIAQLYLSRTGDWHVVASGHCNHNKIGWAGPNEGYGNDNLLGVEAQHSGDGEPWTARQYNSYVRGVAALVRHTASGWDVAVTRVAGHKEHQPGAKTDPSFSMDAFRVRVRDEIRNWEDDMTPEQEAALVKKIRDAVLFDKVIPDYAQPAEGRRLLSLATFTGYADHRRNAILGAISAALGRDLVDEQEVAAAVLTVLTPQAIAGALPDEVAKQVAAELAERLAS